MALLFGAVARYSHRLGERGVTLGHADEVERVAGGNGDDQGLRVGVADVLRGKAHQASGHVHRILAGLDHARQPVDAGVWVAVAHRLVQRRHQVEVLLAVLVVAQRLALQCVLHQREVDARATGRLGRRRYRQLQQIQGAARIAVGGPAIAERLRRDVRRLAPETAVDVGERPFENADQRRLGERLEHEDLRAREQRRVHLEGRVLGRGADEHDVSGLDPRQERVLLRLVEPVDLVDEDDGPAAAAATQLGSRHHVLDLLDA